MFNVQGLGRVGPPRQFWRPAAWSLLAACLSTSLATGGAVAYAQEQTPPASAALAQLFENVLFWDQRGQPEKAAQELVRALALRPRNVDMLAMASRLAYQIGRYDAADAYRDRLREIAPTDPRLITLAADQRRTPAELKMLDEARKLSSAGRKDDALKLYRQLLHGKVPDSLAIEYYIVLGGSSPDGFTEASNELSHVIEHWPMDIRLKLAYAKLQTFQEGTRAAGIVQLRELTQEPAVAQDARAAWREALLWQGADFQTRDQIQAYLQENPGDEAIQAKLEEVKQSLPDEGVLARMRGWEAAAAGKMDDAERELQSALTSNPDDAEAMSALAMIRRLQKRFPEAKKLIDRAIELAPDRRDEFLATVGEGAQSQQQAGDQAAKALREQYSQVARLTKQGNYDKAEQLLRKLMQKSRNAGNYLALGGIQAQAGRLTDAEDSYRHAMQMSPRNPDAVMGLADVLNRQRRGGDADALYAQAQELFARAGNRTGLQALNRSRAERLRRRAETVDDPPGQIALYRAALALDPGDAWVRLGLARALQKQGQGGDARQVMADAVAEDHPSTDALQAAIVFAQETDHLPLASRLIDRLPARDRTPQMRDVQDHAAVLQDIQRATSSHDNPAAVRARLLALAAQPDPSGVRGTEIGRTLLRMNDKAGVRSALTAALASTNPPTQQQRVAYSGVLLGAGLTQNAQALVRSVDRGSLPVPLQKTFAQAMNGIAVQQSYNLSQQGRPAEAFDALAPQLAVDPTNPDLNIALSWLYQVNGKPREARAVAERLLQRDPDNIDVRLAAVDVSIGQGELSRAEQLLAETRKMFPNDPRVYVASANLEKAQGRNGLAMNDLRKARELREHQLLFPQQ